MSSINGRRPHEPSRVVRPVEGDYELAVMPGACLDGESEMAAMRKQTHDGVIAAAGDRRRSGVTWRHWHGLDAAVKFEELYGSPDANIPATLSYAVEGFRAFFAEHGPRAVLILAVCQVASDG